MDVILCDERHYFPRIKTFWGRPVVGIQGSSIQQEALLPPIMLVSLRLWDDGATDTVLPSSADPIAGLKTLKPFARNARL